MHEFNLINNYFFKIAKKNKSALNLNDDVFFDKKRGVMRCGQAVVKNNPKKKYSKKMSLSSI